MKIKVFTFCALLLVCLQSGCKSEKLRTETGFSRSKSSFFLGSLSTGDDDDDDDEDEVDEHVSISHVPRCQLECKNERVRPVCGTDGETYSSRCHLQQAVCLGSKVKLDYRGECSDSETRCLDERLLALKTSNESGIPVFVPVCREDGSYVDVQCHYGTGYCWCVNHEGKPVPGSSVRYDRPKCRQDPRRRNRRGKKKKSDGKSKSHNACTQADRSEFNSHVTELILSEYGSLHGRSLPEGRIADHKKEQIDWKFDQMDINRNGKLRKKEFKSFRRKVKRLSRNKICARHFWRYCDMDADNMITRDEWNNCLGINVNISFKLFMSLSSEDDQGKRRKEKQRKKKEEEDEEEVDKIAEDDEMDSSQLGAIGSTLLDSPESNKSRADCRTTHREAIEATKSGVPNAYIPECDANGNFNRIQCHKSSGYCWCADEETGEPISSTSVFNARPDCDDVTGVRLSPERPWKKCPEKAKKCFQRNLMEFMTKMVTQSNQNLTLNSDENLVSLDENVANWHFNHLDRNIDGKISRRELRPLRNTLKIHPELKRCGKRIQIHCDTNLDLFIDLGEWNVCVGIKKDDALIRQAAISRKGPNPLKTWLKSD